MTSEGGQKSQGRAAVICTSNQMLVSAVSAVSATLGSTIQVSARSGWRIHTHPGPCRSLWRLRRRSPLHWSLLDRMFLHRSFLHRSLLSRSLLHRSLLFLSLVKRRLINSDGSMENADPWTPSEAASDGCGAEDDGVEATKGEVTDRGEDAGQHSSHGPAVDLSIDGAPVDDLNYCRNRFLDRNRGSRL